MQFYENTTTLEDLIVSTDSEGNGITNRGYLRHPKSSENWQESECDVCNATGRVDDIVLRDKDTGEALCSECAEDYLSGLKEEKARNNPYTSYSLSTLEHLAQDYSFKLGGGRTRLANGENLGEAYQQVLEAIEYRQSIDYCKHGVFLHTDYDIPCTACEYAE
jgi:hypothetical protein